MRCWMIGLLIAGLVACQPAPNPNLPPTVDPSLISWDRSPDAVTFRADVIGGESSIRARSNIPLCTVFGDNRIVWVNELGGFNFEVLYHAANDSAIREFIRYLTVEEAIYDFDWRSDDLFATAEVTPVIETVTLTVNDVMHRTDSFSGWDAQLFARVLTLCKQLGTAPILYQPNGGWVSVERVPYNPQAPISQWDSGSMGFSLPSLEGATPRWVTGASLLAIWNALRSLPSSLLYTEDNATFYALALQVPGIMRDAPPPP